MTGSGKDLPEQMPVLTEYIRRYKTVIICGDATGGIVKKVSRPDKSLSQYIFLYSLAIYSNDIITVASMMSEAHDVITIENWLIQWMKIGGQSPDESVCDMSDAFLNADCYIRIDIAYFMKNDCTWSCLKNKSRTFLYGVSLNL